MRLRLSVLIVMALSVWLTPLIADSLLGKGATKPSGSVYNRKKRPKPTFDYSVGDTVIMNVSIRDTWEFTRKFDTKRDISWGAKFKNFITHFGGENKNGLPKVEFEADGELKSDGKSKEESRIRFRIPAEVIEKLPNGDLVLDAARTVHISEDQALVRVGGRVNPKYVKNDEVMSEYILQLDVKTKSEGPLNDNRKRGFIIKFLEKFRLF